MVLASLSSHLIRILQIKLSIPLVQRSTFKFPELATLQSCIPIHKSRVVTDLAALGLASKIVRAHKWRPALFCATFSPALCRLSPDGLLVKVKVRQSSQCLSCDQGQVCLMLLGFVGWRASIPYCPPCSSSFSLNFTSFTFLALINPPPFSPLRFLPCFPHFKPRTEYQSQSVTIAQSTSRKSQA